MTGNAGTIGTFDLISWYEIDTIPDNDIFNDLTVTGKYINKVLDVYPTVSFENIIPGQSSIPAFFEWEYEHYFSDYYVGTSSDDNYGPLKFLYTVSDESDYIVAGYYFKIEFFEDLFSEKDYGDFT